MVVVGLLVAGVAGVASADPVGVNAVRNGDFSEGLTGFGSSYEARVAGTGSMWDPGTITVDDTVVGNHALWTGDGSDGHGDFLLVNGRTDGSSTVWAQTVAVERGASYVFGFDAMNLCCNALAGAAGDGLGPVLSVWINGLLLGSFGTDGPGVWETFASMPWTSLADRAVVEIRDGATAYHGNDFGLDDITLKETPPVPEPASLVLLGTGLTWLVRGRRRIQRG